MSRGRTPELRMASRVLPLEGIPVPAEEAARIWRELATGRRRVLAATDEGGTRHIAVALASTASPVDWARLSPLERRLLSLASRGISQKVIGLELRLPPSTVSRALRRARDLLGFTSFAQLARAFRAHDARGE